MGIFSWFSNSKDQWSVLAKEVNSGQETLTIDFLEKAKALSIDDQWFLISDIWPKLRGQAKKQIVSAIWFESFYFLFHYTQRGSDKRFLAIELLGYIPDQTVADFLLKLMRDKDDNIKLAAAGSMALQPQEIAMPLLLKALRHPKYFLPARIGQAILAYGQAGIEGLIGIYHEVDENIQESIIDLLAETQDIQVDSVLLAALKSSNVNIKSKGIVAIQRLSLKELAPELIKLLQDDAARVRGQAAQALGTLGVEEAKVHLVPLINDEDSKVRVWAEEAVRLLDIKE